MKIKTLVIASALFFSLNASASCQGARMSYNSALNNLQNLIQNNAPSQQIQMATDSLHAAQVSMMAQCHQF